MGGDVGGGGATRHLGGEWQKIIGLLYPGQEQQLGNFVSGQPLLTQANAGAQNFFGGLGGLTNPLQSLMGQTQGVFGGLGQQTRNLQGGISPFFNALERRTAGLASGIQNTFGHDINALGGLANNASMREAYSNTIAPVLRSGGALSPQETRDIEQQTSSAFGARGMAGGNQSIVTDFLNRDTRRQQRFNTALGQGQSYQQLQAGLLGEQAGLRGQESQLLSGLLGQQAGLGQTSTQLQSGLIGQRGGLFGQGAGLQGSLASGIQGLQTGGLNQLMGVEGSNVGNFSALTNPLLNYAGGLFQGNQASALNSQIANQNKQSGLEAGAISSIGNILGGVIGASDKRLKHKIKNLGETTPGGTPIKSFQYRGDPDHQRYIGVIAQDALETEPHAVHQFPSGHLGVNYHSLNMPHFPMLAGSANGHGERTRTGEVPPRTAYNFNFGPGGIDIPPADMRDPFQTELQTEPGVNRSLGYTPPSPSLGAGQGPTMIPTTFDAQGYPYAVPVGGGGGFGGGGGYWSGPTQSAIAGGTTWTGNPDWWRFF